MIQFVDQFLSVQRRVNLSGRRTRHFYGTFFSSFDQRVSANLDDGSDCAILRCVDDFPVIAKGVEGEDAGSTEVDLFKGSSDVLKLAWEFPVKKKIRFLDLLVVFKDAHMCWRYQEPHAFKKLILFDCAHSKLLKAALSRSCNRELQSSFDCQIERLKQAGLPPRILSRVCQSLL